MSVHDLQARIELLMQTVEGVDREAARRNLLILARNWQEAGVAFPDIGERERNDGKKPGQDVVMSQVRRADPELVILDNFSTLSEVLDENDAAAMTPVLSFLLRLKQAGIATILVHHLGKTGTTYRGSSRLATTFEVIIGLHPPADALPGDGAAFTLDWTKYRGEPCDRIRRRKVTLEKGAIGDPPRWAAEADEGEHARVLVREVRKGIHPTQAAVAKALGWDPSKITRTKAKAMADGLITRAEWSDYMAAGASGGDERADEPDVSNAF